jgi:hypothetical protein
MPSAAKPQTSEGLRQPACERKMTPSELEILKVSVDKVVRIVATDGQVLLAKVLLVDEEAEDIVYDLVWTDRPDKYEKLDIQPAYSLPFHAIAILEPYTNEGNSE